jgi:hypothetical protein
MATATTVDSATQQAVHRLYAGIIKLLTVYISKRDGVMRSEEAPG